MSRHQERRRGTPGPSAYADVYVELTLLTFRRLATTVLVSGLGVIVTTGMVAQRFNDSWLWNLTVAMAVVSSVRFSIVLAFDIKPRHEMTLSEATRWLQWYGTATFLHCLCLAMSTLYSFSHHNGVASMLCTIAVFAQCAGLGTRPGMRPWFKQGCSLTMLAALAVSIFRSEAMLATTGSVFIALFAYSHCEAVRNQFSIVVEQLRSRRKLRDLAELDTLTGLANRRHFQDALRIACDQANHPFAILYIDLDHFKAVNDTYGHTVGDILLNRVADRLKRVARTTDLVARLGGDEFSILQKAVVSAADAEALARRVVNDLSSVFEIDEHSIRIGASVGIRLSSKLDRDPRLLLAHADTALYRAKQSGGGNFSRTNP